MAGAAPQGSAVTGCAPQAQRPGPHVKQDRENCLAGWWEADQKAGRSMWLATPLGRAAWGRTLHTPLTTAKWRGAGIAGHSGGCPPWAGVVVETLSQNWAPDSNGGQMLEARMWVWPLRVRNKVMQVCGE